jgi:hypothetical protein
LDSRENIYDEIMRMFRGMDNKMNILETQIDVDVQTEYFEYSKNHNLNINPEDVIKNKDNIFRNNLSVEDKKCMLVKLASINSIEAFRTIERYLNDPAHDDLQDWATLAFHESKLLLQSKLLDENQVLISTGLGGKGFKLRYFTVLMSNSGINLSYIQKKIIRSELHYMLKKNGAELEKLRFSRDLCTILSLIPLKVPIQNLFDMLIEECNKLGDFLNRNCLITNVKILKISEIRERIKNNPAHFR